MTTTIDNLANVPHLPCDLCDDDGMVLGRDGKQVADSEGYEIWCRHGKPVDLDDDETPLS
jgi:hypothetical protein